MKNESLTPTALLTVLLVLPQLTTPAIPVSTFYEVSVHADGNGVWYVEHRYALKSGEDLEAFKAAAETIASETAAEYKVRVERVVAEASSILGREMKLSDFKVTADVRQTLTGAVGVVTISFKWLGFAVKNDGVLSVGDVFIGGLSLMEGESFTVKIPEGYVVENVSPKPDEVVGNLVRWYGRKSFGDGEPRLILSHATTGNEANRLALWLNPALVLTLAAAVLAAVFFARKRAKPVENTDIQTILDIIKRHGGTVSQSIIVDETGMSKARVSMILKLLEENGRVMRFKRGREKIVRIKR
ncbi:MAG: DUF4897 domain-containing protein [Candidatus Caldarchaeum sp.]